ncbi:DUF4126 family protein [Granulicella sp. L60]|jgi:uncharacterized membrane protein|uniref:DUF4126 family protein n=1 Tax=Granulicella sp. L60 TaxID=1641866 RepID=UPI00131A6761|nr:DUF4126 family protein [Granulicella sp. L60]
MIILIAFLLGVVSGLRALAPIAVVSWAARLGLLKLEGTPLAFLGYAFTPYIFTVLALGELINDKLPKTPSRTIPPQFITRIVSGAFVGAAIGLSANSLIIGLLAGAIGAVLGTLGGSAVRGKLAAAFGKDLPAALIEDVVAIVLAIVAVTRLG